MFGESFSIRIYDIRDWLSIASSVVIDQQLRSNKDL